MLQVVVKFSLEIKIKIFIKFSILSTIVEFLGEDLQIKQLSRSHEKCAIDINNFMSLEYHFYFAL